MSTAEMTPELTTQLGAGERTSSRPPQKVRLRRFVPHLVFAVCVSFYFLPFMRLLVRCPVEGTLVEGAVRTVHGQLLGREFFGPIGPGTFYWLGLLFQVFKGT